MNMQVWCQCAIVLLCFFWCIISFIFTLIYTEDEGAAAGFIAVIMWIPVTVGGIALLYGAGCFTRLF